MRRTRLPVVVHPNVYAALSVYADSIGESMSAVNEAALVFYLRHVGAEIDVPIQFLPFDLPPRGTAR